MSPELAALARHRLSQALETLGEGEALMERNSFRGAINRFYYAAFYGARALLALREVDSSKHSGVIALFQQHFVRTGIVTPDTARALPRAFERRLKTDYGDHVIVTAEEARRIQGDVRQFVQECAAVLERLLTET